MQAMVLEQVGKPLVAKDCPIPEPKDDQLVISVKACAVCRTDLHVCDGELPKPNLPLVPGHEIVGTVAKLGKSVTGLHIGQLVGVPWLGKTCLTCSFCISGQENLCDKAEFTGYTRDGGYAEYAVADANFCFPLPELGSAAEVAPLLCAGMIGWRSLKFAGQGKKIGLYGFGAAGHIVMQIANWQSRKIFAFTRPGDAEAQGFAHRLGATWSGGSDEQPPELLDAAIIFAPIGDLVPQALKATKKGGTVVCGGIHMSDIPAFPYGILWEEKSIRSVANLTRQDAIELLALAPQVPIKTTVKTYALRQANEALNDLRSAKIHGAAVLVM